MPGWDISSCTKNNRGAFVMTHTPDLNVGFFFIKNVLYLYTHQPTSPFNYYFGFAPNVLIPSFQIKEGWTKGPLCLPVLTFFSHRSATTATGREISGLVNYNCYAVMFIFTSNSKVIQHPFKSFVVMAVSALTALRLMSVSIFPWPSATGFYTYCLLPSVSYYCVALSLSYLQRYCGWDRGKHFFSPMWQEVNIKHKDKRSCRDLSTTSEFLATVQTETYENRWYCARIVHEFHSENQ